MTTDQFRPATWDDYIGQPKLKERLALHIASARSRGVALDHVLLTGPPGCGKTSLSSLIAAELHKPFDSYVMPVDQKLLELIVTKFSGVVLLDEIHRSPVKQQETLLPLLEDGYLQTSKGQRIQAHDLTIIGATTEPEKVIAPLFDRFTIKPAFEEYSDVEMASIVHRMANKAGIALTGEVAHRLGRSAGGCPRDAKALILMARDQMHVVGNTSVELVQETMRVTADGLTANHLRYLEVLDAVGGTAGIEVLGSHLRLPKAVLLNLERLLVKQNLISYTNSGRELNRATYSGGSAA